MDGVQGQGNEWDHPARGLNGGPLEPQHVNMSEDTEQAKG